MKQDFVKIYTIRTAEGFKNIASLVSQEVAFEKGLLPESIIGYFVNQVFNEEIIPDNFIRNSLFVDLLHKSIKEFAPQTKSFLNTARKLKNGSVYVIDQRTPDPNGAVPSEDIIGAFEIKNSEFIKDSYTRNNNHKILSQNGFFNLGNELFEYLLNMLYRLYDASK